MRPIGGKHMALVGTETVQKKEFSIEKVFPDSKEFIDFIKTKFLERMEEEEFSIAGEKLTSEDFHGYFSINTSGKDVSLIVDGQIEEKTVVVKERNGLWLCLGIVGLFLYVIPGLLCFIIYYLSGEDKLERGDEYSQVKATIEYALAHVENELEKEKERVARE
ncbi:MAG: hypothetical protein KAW41_06330 [Candidatus Diapherotrites archaeon]|nr:hypothetical protein [Candidatus Diapherotrites archaeon]